MTTVTENLDLPAGVEPTLVGVEVRLVGANGIALREAYNQTTGKTIVGRHTLVPDTAGAWTLNLDGNTALIPAGTAWARTVTAPKIDPATSYATVPTTGGPYRWDQILTDPPATIESSALSAHKNVLHRPNVIVPAAWGARWTPSKAAASTRRVPVHIWGDSIFAQGNGASLPRTTSAPGLIEAALKALYGNGGSGFLSHEYATKTGTWTTDLYGGFGGTSVRATATATMQWTAMAGTTVRIFHRNANVTGVFRYRIDGGSFTSITPPTGFGVEPGTVEVTGLADTTHTIDVEWVSGTVYIHGVYTERSTGIIVSRCGQNGRAASHYSPIIVESIPSVTTTNASPTVTTPGAGAFRSSMIGKYLVGNGIPTDTTITAVASSVSATLSANATASATVTADLQINRPSLASSPGTTIDPALAVGLTRADLVIIALGVNDPASSNHTATTFRDGLSRITSLYLSGNVYDYSPDFVFVVPHFANWFDVFTRKAEVASELAAMAASVGGACVDIWAHGKRSFKYWNDLGYFADSVHPNDAGHTQYAQPILDLLALI